MRDTAGDHVISIFYSWTCLVDLNVMRETVGWGGGRGEEGGPCK